MPSILSGCLILLKLAMAVNDGLHTMLSNVYSVLENAMQNDQDREHVEESSSAPAFQRSKSQILDAFNRRRQNPAIYEQTDVLVSNLTPFQEITITNKDVEGRRKLTASPIKKYQCKWIVGGSNTNVERNVETKPPSPLSSESCSPSFVSLDDPEDQSSKTDVFTQVEETKNELCLDNSMDESMITLEDASQPSASRASLSHSKQSPFEDSHFLKSLQERIRLASQHFHSASQICLNAKQQSTKNIWGLTDSDSLDNDDKVLEKVQINSPTLSPEEAVSRKMFLAETTRLYDDFLNNYYTCKDAITNSENPLKSLRTKGPLSTSDSNGDEKTFEDNFSPVTSPNSPPQTSSNDSSMDSSAFEQENISVSSTSSRHESISNVPCLFKKDSWANMDDVLEFINLGSLQKLNEVSTDNIKSNVAPHSKDYLTYSDNHVQPKEELFPFVNHLATGEHAFEASNNYESSIKPNLSSRSLLVCEELDDSGDLEVLSLARVDDLTKVLQEVGATELLGELNGSKNDILNDVSNARLNMGLSSAAELKSNSTSDSKVWNLDNIPWNDLDTEENKINYLNNVTDNYQKDIKNGNLLLDNVLSEDFEHLQKVILETITNAYKSKVDFLIQTANVCLDGLSLTDPGLDIPCREATSNKDVCNSCIPTQISAVEELDAFGLPFFVKKEWKVKNTEHVLRKSAPLEIVSETVFKDDLFDVEKDHSESLFAVDCRHNETSTPKRVEMLEDQNWISINLSSESQKAFEVTSQEKESCVSVNERQNPAIPEEAKNASLTCNGIKSTKDELSFSPNASNVKNGITLEAKDWGDVNAEFYKSYLKCVSILNMCDDEVEDATMKTKSGDKVSDEFCKGNSYAKETETLCESKEQLTESSNCNEVLLLESNKTSLDISKYCIKTCNAGNKDESETNMVHDKLNIDCSSSNHQNISTSGLKCDELSSKDKESADFSKSENANCEVSSNEKCYLDSENSIDKTEVKIADYTQLKVFYKPEHASGPKEGFQSVYSDAVSLEQLLSSTNTVLVKGPSKAKSKKTSVCKKDILNKEFLSNNFDKEVDFYLKCVAHKDINNVKPRKIECIDLTGDRSNYKSESEEQKLNSLQVSKLSVERTRSYTGKSTPQSNIEALQQREELESNLIYDNEDIYDHETENTTHSNSDLPPGDSKQNVEFKNETGVPMLLNCNENGTIASNIEVNNTQNVENVLLVSERTT